MNAVILSKAWQGKTREWQVGDVIRPHLAESPFSDHIIMEFQTDEGGTQWVRLVRPYVYVSQYTRTPLLGFEDYTMSASSLEALTWDKIPQWKFLQNRPPQ